jgi:hypothetical protein
MSNPLNYNISKEETNFEKFALDVLRSNPDFSMRLKEQMEYIKKSHGNLTNAAAAYSTKYQNEVDEGTKKMQKLISEGAKLGLDVEEVLEQNRFMPTVKTPILNMLYFLIKEHPDADKINFNRLAEDLNKRTDIATAENNVKYGGEYHSDKDKYGTEKSPEMDEFIYGNLTHDMFKKVKKLKALSRSSNKAEAFSAYSKCMELCKEYGLEFDKIPCNV